MNKKILLCILAILLGMITTVQIASAAPTLDTIPAQTAIEDTPFLLDVKLVTLADNGTVIFSDNSLLFSIQKLNETAARISFTPTNDNVGSHNINITASDLDSSDLKTFTLTVQNTNDAPVLNLPAKLTKNAQATHKYEYTVSATDVDIGDALTLTYKVSAWTTFLVVGNIISFTPTEGDIGRHSITINVTDNYGGNDSASTYLYVGETCDDDNNLLINDVEITDPTGDEDQLLPGDVLEVNFDVQNKMFVDIDNVEVKAWIEDSNGGKLGDSIELDDKIDIASHDEESASLQFAIPADAKLGTYYLFISALGDDENDTERCDAYYDDIKIEREAHDLLIENISFMPSTVNCGGSVEVSVPIWNIGTNTEDDIKLSIKNSDLDIAQSTDVFELKSKGSDADALMKVIIEIPEDAKSGDYLITAEADFNSNKDSESKTGTLTIKCAGTEPGELAVTADKTSAEAIVGEKTKFTLTLENTGENSATFSVQGAASWADIVIDPEEVTLDAGDSTDVYIYVTPKAASEHTLTVSVYSGGEKVNTQKFTVDVSEAQVSTNDWGHAITSGLKSSAVQIGLVAFVIALIVVSMLLFAFKPKRGRKIIAGKGK